MVHLRFMHFIAHEFYLEEKVEFYQKKKKITHKNGTVVNERYAEASGAKCTDSCNLL